LLRETLPPAFAIHYSVKANPNPAILKHFVNLGCGLEIASAGEFCRALEARCPAERILFAGPGKTERELELVLKRGIGEIHIESLLEAERISAICQRLSVRAQAAIRVNPSGGAQGGAMRMGGKPAPFGIDEERLDVVLESLLSDFWIDFKGIHLFSGTQILDHAILIAQYRKGLEIAKRVASRINRPIDTLDFGGGLGIPYFPNEQELNIQKLREELAALMEEIEAEPFFAGTRFIVEPGRFLVGDSGIYATRVNDIKTSRGKKFLIVDGGMNHHLAASGNLGQVIKRNFPVAILNKLDDMTMETVDVVGPLCTPLDVLARDADLPRADVGDMVGVFQSGAYARSASPLGFLSHPNPPEVWVGDGEIELIRQRSSWEHTL
jgi:diaminopimelate decarboxylase